MDSGGGGSAEVMVYSLGWGMGEPERRGADRKRAQPVPVTVVHSPLSPDEGHEVDVLPLHNQVLELANISISDYCKPGTISTNNTIQQRFFYK